MGVRLIGGRSPLRLGWALAALAVLCPSTVEAQTPAGTRIESAATVSYETGTGQRLYGASNTLVLTVAQVAGVSLGPARHSEVRPGDDPVLAHTLRNVGNGPDAFTLDVTSARGWATRLFVDRDGDGRATEDEAHPWASPLDVAMGDSLSVLVGLRIPDTPDARGASDTVRVRASSGFAAGTTDAVVDRVDVQDAGVDVALENAVDRSRAAPGALLTYTVQYRLSGSVAGLNFVLTDSIPRGTEYVPGTILWNGEARTDAAGDDEAEHDPVAGVVRLSLDRVSPEAAGELSFQVRLRERVSPVSTAHSAVDTRLGRDTVRSNTVRTEAVTPDLALNKTLLSPELVSDGDSVLYTLAFENLSDGVEAYDVLLVDTLPEALSFVSASREPLLNGQELRWEMGTLPADSLVTIRLVTRVVHPGTDTLSLLNVASLSSASTVDSASIVAQAAAVAVNNAAASALTLTKTADALEVGLGDVAPYTVVVENTGSRTLDAVRVVDVLPAGTRLIPESVAGGELVVGGDTVTFALAEPLAPGGRAVLRYTLAVLSAEDRMLRNTAYATAGAGVRSQEALAMVRVRRAHAMATRSAIGKVWVDVDGDGVQGAGEGGVPGVDIWSDGGEVATTDEQGRFSIRNLDTGRRSFRLDPATLPLAYGLEDGLEAGLQIRDASGWSTPRVNFRLVPREARLRAVALPLDVVFQARPIRDDGLALVAPREAEAADSVCVESSAGPGPIRLEHVEFELDRATLTPSARLVLDQVAEVFLAHPELRAEVAGHTDVTGPAQYNQGLSERRARSVVAYLVEAGVDVDRLTARGYGPDRPVASNETREGRARNRRVEMAVDEESEAMALAAREVARAVACAPLPAPRRLGEYRLEVRNPYRVALGGLLYEADRGFDSIQVRLDGAELTTDRGPAGRRFELPVLPPGSELVVLGWFDEHPDSAVARLWHRDEAGTEPAILRAQFHNPLMPVSARPPLARMDSFPSVRDLPGGTAVSATLDAAHVWGDSAVYRLPTGWTLADTPGDYRRVRDRDGGEAVAFALAGGAVRELPLRPADARVRPDSVRLEPLRTAEEREAEQRRALLVGPAVELFHPLDGSVHAADRLFIGVKGEPGAEIAVFDTDSLLREGTLRPDGVADFVAVKLEQGPHRLRVRMRNSWGRERWDSLTVHVSGEPVAFEFERPSLALVADGHTVAPVGVRVVDAWGVPVTHGPAITLEATGARPVATDADGTSVGLQARPDAAGWLRFDLRPGHDVGAGELRVRFRDAQAQLPLEVLPPVQPLMVTAAGRVGLGASPEDYGSVTVRGRLDDRTSLLLRYDSREQADAFQTFDRAVDPLDPAQYPVLGDGGARRAEGTTRGAFSARIRRGLDWVAVGDLTTLDFADDLTLTTYRRAITGAAARVGAGPTVLQAFASATRQRVVNDRLRGQGISGPYQLDGPILPGTDRVVLETRALENPDRVLTSQVMTRWADYQVDYRSGVLLFKRPVPAVDPHGNPVFIAVTFETENGGAARPVWGLRGTAAATDLLGLEGLEARLGGTVIREDGLDGTFQLTGTSLRLGGGASSELAAELSHARSADSSGLAINVEGSVMPVRGLTLRGSWRSIGDGYHNPTTGRHRSGSTELRLIGEYDVGVATIALSHERQEFTAFDVERERTRAGVIYPMGRDVTLEAGMLNDGFGGATELSGGPAGEAKLSWEGSEDLKLWVDARRHLVGGVSTPSQPDFTGAGIEYGITDDLKVSGRHRQVALMGAGEEDGYGVSDIGLRSRFGGGEIWSSYQLAGIDGARSAALVGLNNRIALGRSWTVGGSMERRMGLTGVDPADPVRALPFLQQEEDYWAATLSVEHVPHEAPYRFSGRSEYRDGETRSTRLAELAGELSLDPGLAVLSRQELMQVETDLAGDGEVDRSRRLSSLWGLAFRPIADDRLNVLAKFEWLDAVNPLGGGVLTSRGDERRLIGAAEAIWEPARDAELALRVASRRAEASQLLDDGTHRRLTASAQFVGWRASLPLTGRFGARIEGRTLLERNTGVAAHDVAPQLTFAPVSSIEVASGYRFGDLQDPDFAVSGGHGLFLTVGARLTERTLGTAADYWRARVGR